MPKSLVAAECKTLTAKRIQACSIITKHLTVTGDHVVDVPFVAGAHAETGGVTFPIASGLVQLLAWSVLTVQRKLNLQNAARNLGIVLPGTYRYSAKLCGSLAGGEGVVGLEVLVNGAVLDFATQTVPDIVLPPAEPPQATLTVAGLVDLAPGDYVQARAVVSAQATATHLTVRHATCSLNLLGS